MRRTQSPMLILNEIAEFLASAPTRQQFLKFRPSKQVQERIGDLLLRQNAGELSPEERRELDQFAQVEVLMRLVKAKIVASKASSS